MAIGLPSTAACRAAMPGPHSLRIGEGASVSTTATSRISPRSGEVARGRDDRGEVPSGALVLGDPVLGVVRVEQAAHAKRELRHPDLSDSCESSHVLPMLPRSKVSITRGVGVSGCTTVVLRLFL